MKNWDTDTIAFIAIFLGIPLIFAASILFSLRMEEVYHLEFMKICAHEGLQYKYDNDRLICVK